MDTLGYILAESSSFWAAGWLDWVLSVAIFAMVVLFFITVFGQGGEVKLSPQREAAIATGHTDRKTVFENPIFRPLLWILLSLACSLRTVRFKAYLKRQLIAAGSPNYYTPEEYLAVSMLTGLAIGLMLQVFYVVVIGQVSLSLMVMGLVIGVSLSVFQIASQAGKRLREITKQLPYALDLVSLAMNAGATFPEAIKAILRDDDEEPLNIELRALLAEIDLGTTRREALRNMSLRVPLASMRSLVASVTQAEELGTPLANVLHDQATLLRMQRSIRAENLAAVASIRILVPCMLLVMAVILTVFGPAIVRVTRDGMF